MKDEFERTIPLITAAVVDKWDKEWMHYLSTESKWPHLIQSSKLQVQTDVRCLDRAEMFTTNLTVTADAVPMAPLRIWATGSEIIQRSVAEIGCGAGFLGKQIGLVAARYLGIDVSQLALAIARGNSGPNCLYLHIGERALIAQEFGKYDTVLGREFFIHQNFANAIQVLRLSNALLAKGGRICADFYLPNPNIEQGVVHPARAELDSHYASCAFAFSNEEIRELAQEVGLTMLSLTDDFSEQRRFVVFAK